MVRKVAIYVVSPPDQTVDNQLIELRDHCSKMGWRSRKNIQTKVCLEHYPETNVPHSIP